MHLAKSDNGANVLHVRKDVFTLVDTCNFSYNEALFLLIPSYFKERVMKMHNRQQGNPNHWNRA